MTDIRIFSSAARYIQGPGALERIGEFVDHLGDRTAVFIDAFMHPSLADGVARSLTTAAIESRVEPLEGEVTLECIAEVTASVASFQPQFIVGVGGGKTIDIAKGVARTLSIPIVTAPTVASNDSPASRVIAVYDDSHRLSEVLPMTSNPACVIVDSAIIAGAPSRFLSAGIGDAISKRFEVESCLAAGGMTPQGTEGLGVAQLVASGCYRILREHGAEALKSAEQGEVTEALEKVIEATVLLSGLAFENGGLSIAHAVTRGLMVAPASVPHLHGEHVAYGLMLQFALAEESDEALDDLAGFLRTVGLPDSLTALDVDASPEVIDVIVSATLTAPHIANFPVPVNAKSLERAILRVENRFADG